MRAIRFHSVRRTTALCLALFAAVMFTVAACHGGPVVDLSTKPAQADGTISGTVSAVVRGMEGASASDDSLQVGLYLISGDGTSVVATLYAGHTEALNATAGALGQEIASASMQTRIIPATSITSQTATAGQRLMILVGYRTHDISATLRTSTLRLGDPTATADYALTSGLTTDLTPWVELSADLSFASGGTSVPVGQAVETDTAGTVTPGKARVVDQTTEADTAGTVAARKAATVGQVAEVDTAQTITPTAAAGALATGPRLTSASRTGRSTTATGAGRVTTTTQTGRLQ